MTISSDPHPPRKRNGWVTTMLLAHLVIIAELSISYSITFFNLSSHAHFQLALPLALLLTGCIVLPGLLGVWAVFAWKKWGMYLLVVYLLANLGLWFWLPNISFGALSALLLVLGLSGLLHRSQMWRMMS